MPAREDPYQLTTKQLTAFKYHEMEHKTIPQTADILGVDESTIDNWKTKPAWHELAQCALAKGHNIMEEWAESVWAFREKKKQINVDGELEEVDDNIAQGKFIDVISDTFGLKPPQQLKIVAGPSDADLDKELAESAKKFAVEPVENREQGPSPDNTGEIQGMVL